jgi:membrane associated rhomboid family serine protease
VAIFSSWLLDKLQSTLFLVYNSHTPRSYMSQFIDNVKSKSKEILIINFFIFVPMWTVFLLNNYVFGNYFNNFGIHPRNFSILDMVLICTSWLLHGNYGHIVGNTTVLFPLLFMVCLLEKNPVKPISFLIILSGLFTWLLGMSNSVHIGASGLVFALFGYILASLLIGKNYLYLIPVALVGYFYSQSIFHGLVPKEEISFAAHFGGFIGGIIIGSLIHKKEEQQVSYTYKKTFKEKWDSFVWDMKYKLKR